MDPGFPSERPSLSYNVPHDSSGAGQDHLAYQPRAEPFPGNIQWNGMEVSPRSPSFPRYPNGNWDGKPLIEKRSVLTCRTVFTGRYWPNQQLNSNSQPFPSNGVLKVISCTGCASDELSHVSCAYNVCALVFPDLSPIQDQGNFIETNNRHVAPILEHGAAGRGGSSPQMVQGEIMDHFGPQGASPDSLGSSFAMPIDNSFSLLTELCSQSAGVQDDCPYTSSPLSGQVEGAAQSHMAAREHKPTAQEPSRRRVREQKKQEKKRKDKERKLKYRADGRETYARICELLEIDLMPENTRPQRSE